MTTDTPWQRTDSAYRITAFADPSDAPLEIVRCDINGGVTVAADADAMIASMLASVHGRERALAWQAKHCVDGARMPGIVNDACVEMSRMADDLVVLAMRLRESTGENPLTLAQIMGQTSDDIGAAAVRLVSQCHETLSRAGLLPPVGKTPPEVERSRGVVSPFVNPGVSR